MSIFWHKLRPCEVMESHWMFWTTLKRFTLFFLNLKLSVLFVPVCSLIGTRADLLQKPSFSQFSSSLTGSALPHPHVQRELCWRGRGADVHLKSPHTQFFDCVLGDLEVPKNKKRIKLAPSRRSSCLDPYHVLQVIHSTTGQVTSQTGMCNKAVLLPCADCDRVLGCFLGRGLLIVYRDSVSDVHFL